MYRILLLIFILLITACTTVTPPKNQDNACSIFKQYPSWHRDMKDVQHRWKVPVSVQLAIIHQESRFDAKAQPPRTKLLWFIPWTRPSSAYGYTQALDSTWKNYKRDEGGFLASRDNFADGVDFIGWYANQAYQKARLSRTNAYKLYLAYHEGIGGYQRRTYLSKPWLIQVAHKVNYRAKMYRKQLYYCRLSA